MLGIGAIIGTGIFVLTGVAAADYAGPGLMLSFIFCGITCAFVALCYAELAAMIPVAGSAYTFGYVGLGELWAWIIGWDLILEYVVAVAAVAVGWSGYIVSLLKAGGINIPHALCNAPGQNGGIVKFTSYNNSICYNITLIKGVSESAKLNNILVIIKLAVVILFIVVGVGHVKPANWNPFLPYGVSGIFKGAAIIFFAYLGFDAVSTAAEEVKNPQRDLPIGILASLAICTVLYIIVSGILTGMVPYQQFHNNAAPVAYALQQIGLIGVLQQYQLVQFVVYQFSFTCYDIWCNSYTILTIKRWITSTSICRSSSNIWNTCKEYCTCWCYDNGTFRICSNRKTCRNDKHRNTCSILCSLSFSYGS